MTLVHKKSSQMRALMLPPQAVLRERLHYDPETGVFRWRSVTNNRMAADGTAGWVRDRGYIRISLEYRTYYAHRLAWLYVHGAPVPPIIDHIDGNPSNNRIANLRAATHPQNIANARRRRDNTSGFKGVSWHSQTRKWLAQIGRGGKTYHLGLFETPELAHQAYCAAATRLFENFARFGGAPKGQIPG